MKGKIKEMCRAAVVAALYVALTLVNPFSFGSMQFRVSDILGVLPLINKKMVPAILLGVGIANAFSPLGIVDVVAGVAANGIAYAILCSPLGEKFHTAVKVVILSICIGGVVGAEIAVIYSLPIFASIFAVTIPTMIASTIGIFVMKAIPKGLVR